MVSIAYAGETAARAQSPFDLFVPLIIMFAIFYFLLIRPQQKRNKEHREMVANLKKGDRIITSGGIHGKITGVADGVLTVEIADKVRVKVNRGNVSVLAGANPQAPASKDQPGKK